MTAPVFTQTIQIAIVVRDLDAAMRTYVHDYGIGPWEIYGFDPGKVADMLRNNVSDAGTKSPSRSQCTVVPCAKAGARPLAKMPASPPAPDDRNLRRSMPVMVSLPM